MAETSEGTNPRTHSPPPGARIAELVLGRTAPAPPPPPVEELLHLLHREIDKSHDPQHTAELKARAALLTWDGRGHGEDALRLVQGVDHPIAMALRLHAAIDARDNTALLAYADEALRRGEGEDLAEVGELLLFRGEHARAAVLLERSGESNRLLRAVALCLAGRFAEAVEVLSSSSDMAALPLAAHLAEDRLGDAERARTLLRRVIDRPGSGIGPREQLRAVEWLLDLEARRGGEGGRIELYRRKLELLGGSARLNELLETPRPCHAEVFKTALLLGQALDRLGTPPALSEAQGLLGVVGRFCQLCPEGAALLGQQLVLRARARIEAVRGNYREAALLYEDLGRRIEDQSARLPAEDPLEPLLFSLSLAHTRRAAELWDTRLSEPHPVVAPAGSGSISGIQTLDAPPDGEADAPVDSDGDGDRTPPDGTPAPGAAERARDLYRRLCSADPADGVLVLTYVRLLLSRGAAPEAASVLLLHARASGESATLDLLRAARAAESVHDTRGAERWLDLAAAGQRGALEALARMIRRRADRPHLCAVYQKLAALRPAPAAALRRANTYLSVAAALALEALPAREAEALCETARAEEALPGGLLVLFARVLLLRRLGRHAELAEALRAAAGRTGDTQTQVELLRQLAHQATQHLSDAGLAQSCYERVLELRPSDIVSMHALATLLRERQPAQAIVLLRQAVDAALHSLVPPTLAASGEGEAVLPPGPQAAALLLCELGSLYQQPGPHRDTGRAAACFEDALQHDPRCAPASLGLLDLLREGSSEGARGALLQALQRVVPLFRDPAQRLPLLLEMGRCAESLAAAEPAAGAPGGTAAGYLAQALSAYTEALGLDPSDDEALRGLERLCRQTDDWAPLYTVLAAAFARLYGDRVAAVDHSGIEAALSPRALRLLSEASERLGKWEDVARFREHELAHLSEPAEVLRAARALADLYEQRLGQPDAAARVWERAFLAEPEGTLVVAAVPAALERLYTSTARWADLAQLWQREIEQLQGQLQGQLPGQRQGPRRPSQPDAGAAGPTPERPAPVADAAPAAAPADGEADAGDDMMTLSPEDVALEESGPVSIAHLAESAARKPPGRDAAPAAAPGAAAEPPPPAADLAELRVRQRDLLLKLGVLQRDRLMAPAQAAAIYERLLQAWPEDPDALQALSGLYTEQDQRDALRRVLDVRARLADDPQERAQVLLQAGEVAEKGGDLAVAEEAYHAAYYLSTSFRAAFTALERVLYRRERWEEVLKMYDSALHLVEEQKSRAYRLGDLYARRGQVLLQYLQRPDEAADDYGKALSADPDNDAIQAALERIYAQDGRWAELIAVYERRAQLVKDDGKRVEILRRAARVAGAKLRDIPEAIRLFQRLHAVDPTDTEALDTLERHYDRAQSFEKLLALLGTRLALTTGENEAIALSLRMGLICEEGLRDHDRAIACYRQALEHQPNHREALDALARLFEANERWAELVEISRRQIRLTTDRGQKALLYFKCGSVMEAKFAKEDDAIRYYEAAVKTSPSCLPAVHGLRDIYLRREDWPRVTQTLELEAKLWTEDKERAGIYAHIGQIYRDKLNDPERAIQYYESALAVDKDCLPANRALFDVFYQRGDWGRAVPMGQMLSAKVNREGDPQERSEFYRKRAVVAEHTVDLRTAAESLIVSLEIQPENLEALQLLVSLCQREAGIADFTTIFRELEKLYRRRGPGLTRGLALSLVARSVLAERAYDVETAEALLAEAVRLAPGDFIVVEALVASCERLRRFGPAREALLVFIAHKEPPAGELRGEQAAADQARARLRMAEMYSEAALDPEGAARVLAELLESAVPPADPDGTLPPQGALPPPGLLRVARFRLVQELFVLTRLGEARAQLEALIDEAVRPPGEGGAGSLAPPEELARYYDYLGRILEAQGDGAAAQRTYRRATDLDPGYALPVMALARRAARAGDPAQAELLVREALTQVQGRGDLAEELRLRRGIARLLAGFDPTAAQDAYRQAIALSTSRLSADAAQATTASADVRGGAAQVVARETLDDRVSLCDLLLQDDRLTEARDELLLVLQRDLRYAPAYRLLLDTYLRLGEEERAGRVAAVLALLGYAEADMPEAGYRPNLRRAPLTDELRAAHLLPPAVQGPYQELIGAISEHLGTIFPPPWPLPPGSESAPVGRVADAGFKVCLADTARLYGLDPEVLVARGVPGGMLAIDGHHLPGGRSLLVLESSLLDRPEADRRFLLGRGFEILRGGYALLLSLRPAVLAQVAKLLDQLLLPDDARDEAAGEFVRTLPRKALRTVERLSGAESRVPVSTFLSALQLCADRGGLLSCDDVAASVRMLARLQGEELALLEHGRGDGSGGVLLGQVAGGTELLRYFLSDSYHQVRESLKDATRL